MAENQIEQIAKLSNPLVFISHDTRDAELAEAFSNLLKSVSAGVLKSFRTSDRRGNQGIEYGVEWYPEIIKNIQSASDVVCLLTKRSIDRPWILFEAGMAKGKLDTPILGVALGVELKDASSGPFAQFQNCGGDEDSLTKLVFQLVTRIPNSEPDEDTINFQVGKFRQTVVEILKKLDGPSDITGKESTSNIIEIENSSAKLFEEIKIMFQDLPSRIEKTTHSEGKRRRRRFHPGMFEEMFQFSKDPKISIKMALSLYREKMPWVYDEGILLLKKLESSKAPATTERAIKDLEELLMRSTRNPFVEEFLIEDKEEYFLFMELPRLILRNVMALAI
ncbi:toll/interleukin-1 receptor domain-containing protein [Undibacterium sp. CY18W]|uniref:Toll/interleukin-1 receptor domain-containing protein n=1 Tax=Undibacterium hunanense TaxID=2762292 RepID=A0ABR6ZPW4_9BURK|nr:toll/interleukin-1 receptor domain-containing protein [Undibacterium hunanense]MBC3917603.1 toll/interleukin-1 receptor domain-containing protein [Undibacterium hunanense]